MLRRARMNQLRQILLILPLFFTAVPAIAQKDSLSLISSTTLRVDVDLVNVAFNVFDRNQRQVENLQKATSYFTRMRSNRRSPFSVRKVPHFQSSC